MIKVYKKLNIGNELNTWYLDIIKTYANSDRLEKKKKKKHISATNY